MSVGDEWREILAYLQALHPFLLRAGRGGAGDDSDGGAEVTNGGWFCTGGCDMCDEISIRDGNQSDCDD
jgi:hypothetical protein